MPFYSLLTCVVPDERLSGIFISISLYTMSHLLLTAFKFFFLLFILRKFITCLVIILFIFLVSVPHLAS